MLNDRSAGLASLLDRDELYQDFLRIASFVRRSDGEGEEAARQYVQSRLAGAGVSCSRSAEKGLLAFGGPGVVTLADGASGKSFPARAWNFSAPADGVRGVARRMGAEDFPVSPLDYLSSRVPHGAKRDLAGCVVLSRSFSPEAVLSAQDRGAAGFVICWPTEGEREIHQSGVAMMWGTPLPEETGWLPSIPVLAVNGADGRELMGREGAELSLSCASEVRVSDVVRLEARFPSTEGEPYFLLVGAHLDSKHYGATDNATGAALALALALAAARMERRRFGLRVCWWSGHEFGKYAGSSNYARERFEEVLKHCLCYTNIDMPGMRGASDFSSVTAGPDLFSLAADAVYGVTGQRGAPVGRVRSWDQSFQNIGVSPFFIWTSALPQGDLNRTGGTSMPWWWHTEADTVDFCDRRVLETDAEVYASGLSGLMEAGEGVPLDVGALCGALQERLKELREALRPWLDLRALCAALDGFQDTWRERGGADLAAALSAVRLLNRMYYAARGPHLQDWSGGADFVPGLSEAARLLLRGTGSDRAQAVILNYAASQLNRLLLLADALNALPLRGEGPVRATESL